MVQIYVRKLVYNSKLAIKTETAEERVQTQ